MSRKAVGEICWNLADNLVKKDSGMRHQMFPPSKSQMQVVLRASDLLINALKVGAITASHE